MKLTYSDHDPSEFKAYAVCRDVCVSRNDDVEGYCSPAEARAFAAELIRAADEAESYVMTEQDLADEAEG